MIEKVHDVSVDEPSAAHQAILFILDVLIRNGQEISVETLYNSFGDPTFSPQMLRAVGSSDQGLRAFLLRYPSLFTLNANDIVRANDGVDQLPAVGYRNGSTPNYRNINFVNSNRVSTIKSSNNLIGTLPGQINSHHRSGLLKNDEFIHGPHWDTKTMKEIEQEAIAFFKKQMTRKEEEWLPIVSVAGHASQASPDIRKFVGPQNEFMHFLVRYPDVFVVREEYCGLKGKADKPNIRFPPPSPPPKRRISENSNISRVTSFNNSFGNSRNFGSGFVGPSINSASGQSNSAHMQLSSLEVKSVHYIMRLLHRCGKMLVQNVPNLLTRAPEPIANTVGKSRDQLVHFFKLHSAIFQLHPDGCVSVKSDAVRALIHKDKSFTENSVFTSSGIVLRIFPKYGILNMESNEQVFFDIQSCQFESFGDLTCILHPGDRLWFNAMLGPKDGSTKWRSLKTWINSESSNNDDNKLSSPSSLHRIKYTNGNRSQTSDDSSSREEKHSGQDDLDPYQLSTTINTESDESIYTRNECDEPKKEPSSSCSLLNLQMLRSSLGIISPDGRLEFVEINNNRNGREANDEDAEEERVTDSPLHQDHSTQTVATGEIVATNIIND